MKDTLQRLIDSTNPKNLAPAVKKDTALLKWVQMHHGDSLAEKIYNALHPNEHTCKHSNRKKFSSVTTGYRFCGRAGVCQCAKETVSEKVAAAKNAMTATEKEAANQKRAATNVEKYGVSNAGQTNKAKANHAAFYADQSNVDTVNTKVAQTKKERHGAATYNNSNKIKETFRKKRNNGFWQNKFPEKNIELLESKEKLLKLFNTKTIVEIAEDLNVHIQTVYRYLNIHKIREPFKSVDEKEIEIFLHSIGITNIVRNTRKLLPSKKEIDFFLPEYNIAIEYNGIYWHHEDVAHITRDYHWRKFKECEELGIQLITIFSNFWHSKKEIVKETLKNKLSKSDDVVAARKCSISALSSRDCKEFLNRHHIQGYTPAQVAYGLYYNNHLKAVMSFSQSRIAIGNKTTNYELVRFASSTRIVGGASKLLAQFKKDHPGATIISYSDNEWSDGNLYKALGFLLESEVKPSYWYLKPKEHRLYHRYTFNKQKLVKLGYSSELTESQITKEMGLLKVWDCGKRKWVLKP